MMYCKYFEIGNSDLFKLKIVQHQETGAFSKEEEDKEEEVVIY